MSNLLEIFSLSILFHRIQSIQSNTAFKIHDLWTTLGNFCEFVQHKVCTTERTMYLYQMYKIYHSFHSNNILYTFDINILSFLCTLDHRIYVFREKNEEQKKNNTESWFKDRKNFDFELLYLILGNASMTNLNN